MEKRSIGQLQVTICGIGCNNFGMRIDYEKAKEVVDAALAAGINHFDSADIYGNTESERMLGRALGKRRSEVVVATKFGMLKPPEGVAPGSARWVHEACNNSLERLGSEYIDLYYLHRPDPSTPMTETLGALNELVVAGKVREIACSGFDAALLDEAASTAASLHSRAYAAVQNENNLLKRDDAATFAAAARHGVAYVPYFPLAMGLLTGKYRKGEEPPSGTRIAAFSEKQRGSVLSDERMLAVERLGKYAAAHGHTLLELAMSWSAAQPVASVIAGATSAEQVRSNAAAVQAWPLSADELAEIEHLVA